MTDLDAFEAMARHAYDSLPDGIKAMTGTVQIRVADWPDGDALDALGITEPRELLGLFEGLGFVEAPAVVETGALPNRIWLYREPILAYEADTGEALYDIVRHVLVHEIGHHFGLSDDDMYAIDDAPD